MNIYNYDTYIFNFDAVIIDSEKYHFLSYKHALEKLNIDFEFTYDIYSKSNYSDINNLLKNTFTSRVYNDIYVLKTQIYIKFIKENITLQNGFKEFYYNLLKSGKDVFIITDLTKEIYTLFLDKYDFLKTIYCINNNNTILQISNSELYLHILQSIPNLNIVDKLKKIIVFESTYYGYISANNIFYTVVLVNSTNYYYFNLINPLNYIDTFINIDNIKIKYDISISKQPFYISSKTIHREKWFALKTCENFNITSRWIYQGTSKDVMTIKEKEELCQTFLDDIKNSDFGIFYSEKQDEQFFGTLIEFGMLASLNKIIYIMGDNKFKNEVFYHLNENIINYTYVDEYDITKNIYYIYINNDIKYKELCNKVSALLNTNTIIIKNSKIIDYVAIIACGEGTRLFPITHHIPKLLVCINNNSILNNIINYWKNYTSKFVIVIQQKYNNLVKYYMNILQVEYQIINVEIQKGQENSFTIHNALSNACFQDKKILLTWCDIYPTSNIPDSIFSNSNIIFTYKNFGRYDAIENNIIKKQFGNIIGIYYFSNFKNIVKFKETMDICDCYKDNFGDFDVYEIDSLIDIGDINKLNTLIYTPTTKYITRYFNNIITTENNTLIKKSTCNYGDIIINNELLFYRFHYFHNFNNLPKIYYYSNNTFEMEKLNNITIYNYFITQPYNIQCKCITDILFLLNTLHSINYISISNTQLDIDINIEFISKLKIRIDNVYPILHEFTYIKSINNINIIYDTKYIISKLSKKIKSFFLTNIDNYKYYTIHGDSHLSNMIYSNNNIYLIDPRGYFGKTKLFGPKEYDVAKVLYSLSGFDEFNNNEKYIFYLDNNNITLSINNNMDIFLHLFTNYDKNILIYMVILHWFGLADYSKTNIHKCISAYYYGIYLYHKYCI